MTEQEMAMATAAVDRSALESKVKSMYSDVASNPHGAFHFEMGRAIRFISDRARKATAKWGVKRVSILARKS
jgi:hypothetical protein